MSSNDEKNSNFIGLNRLAHERIGGASHPTFFPLSEHTIAREISPNGMPLYRTYTFTTDDEQVASWLLIWRDARVHSVEWRWYWPEGRTYARSFSTIPPSMDSRGCGLRRSGAAFPSEALMWPACREPGGLM